MVEHSIFDGAKVIPYLALLPSSRHGCVNVILPDGSVLSAHGDTRPAGVDGPWEQGEVAGQSVTFRAEGVYFTYIIVPVGKLP